jgi:hypothetical protein
MCKPPPPGQLARAAPLVLLAFLATLVALSVRADEDCAVCHEELTRAFSTTIHGRIAAFETLDGITGCVTCHGDGIEHMESGGEASLIRGLGDEAPLDDVTDAAFDSLSMMPSADFPQDLFPSGLPGPGEPDPGPPGFATKDYDFSQIHEYTNLAYNEWRSTLGFRCGFAPGWRLYGLVAYYELGDLVNPDTDQVAVWDNTGSTTIVNGGLIWTF